MPTVNWSHPLLAGALDVIWSGKDALTPKGSLPTTTETGIHADIDALGGGDASSGYVQAGVPGFVGHTGDMTITVVAMAHTATKGTIGGYDYFNGSTYGNLILSINERDAGGYDSRGALKVAFAPLRSGYQAPVIIGSPYTADTSGQPFYNQNELHAISYALTGASTNDLRTVVDGVTKASGYTRANAISTAGGTTAYSGIGLGGRHVGSSGAMHGANGAGSIALIIVHNRKLSEAEQQSLTADPWQIFDGLTAGGTLNADADGSAIASGTANASYDGPTIVDAAASGTAVASGTANATASTPTVVSEPLYDNVTPPNLLANEPLTYVAVYHPTTGALVVRKTGLSTGADGRYTFTDPAIATGIDYLHDWLTASGHRRMPVKAAA